MIHTLSASDWLCLNMHALSTCGLYAIRGEAYFMSGTFVGIRGSSGWALKDKKKNEHFNPRPNKNRKS